MKRPYYTQKGFTKLDVAAYVGAVWLVGKLLQVEEFTVKEIDSAVSWAYEGWGGKAFALALAKGLTRYLKEKKPLAYLQDLVSKGSFQLHKFGSLFMEDQIHREAAINHLMSEGYSKMLRSLSREEYLEEWKCWLHFAPSVDVTKIPFSLGCEQFRISEGNVENQTDVRDHLVISLFRI